MNPVYAYLAVTFANLTAAAPERSATTYSHDVLSAVAALVTLVAVLTVVCLAILAVYRVLRMFVRSAGWLTLAIVALVVAIGVLNR